MNKPINISTQLAYFILTLNETLLIIRMACGQLFEIRALPLNPKYLEV